MARLLAGDTKLMLPYQVVVKVDRKRDTQNSEKCFQHKHI